MCCFQMGWGQISSYKTLYQKADSLALTKKVGVIDPKLYQVADSLSALHPMEYFKTAAAYFGKQQLNEASFLYYVGFFRYRYYNSSNPNYKPSGDGALVGALAATLGEPINLYLHANIENYIGLLALTLDYLQNHDFKFYSKDNHLEKYEAQLSSAEATLEDLKTQKRKYQKEWKKERKEIEALVQETN